MTSLPGDLHARRPSVYLDQWVWFRLAAAAKGKPRETGDSALLEAVRRASNVGVAFPLSATHYIETSKVTAHRQRADLSNVMAPVSHCRSLRSRRALLRDQMLTAMHESFGRPTFRPEPSEPLGIGVHWAFLGEQYQLNVHAPKTISAAAKAALPPDVLCRMMQWAETQFLAGPRDDEVEKLRRKYGYRPEETGKATASRLEWEELYVGLLRNDPISRAELRVRVQAREVIHEHLELLTELFHEYRLSFDRLMGGLRDQPGSARSRMTAFWDSLPSVRIAVDMKAELFRNSSKTWTFNDLHDIDFLSFAVPYCHVVVADKAAVDSLRRTHADERNGTRVICRLPELIHVLPDLERAAGGLGGDASGWDWLAPGVGFDPLPPDAIR